MNLTKYQYYKEDIMYKPASIMIGNKDLIKDEVISAEVEEVPATEPEALQIMRQVAASVLGGYGFNYTLAENENLYNNTGGGRFDLAVFVDVNDNGKVDKRLGMNYITGSEEMVNVSDTNAYKFKQISQSSQTTKDYLTTQFTNWMTDIDYSSI